MADQTQSTLVINAPPSAVMAVIADFPAYPEWSAEFRSVEVLETSPDGRARDVRFVMDAGVIKDTYVLRYTWSGADAVSWSLVEGGLLTDLEGAYELADVGDGRTEVTYRLSVALSLPMLGLMKRKAERVVIDRALKGLQARVEGVRS
jgi:ribosome-associated toxin RatA of RatAB toxin-antitoxin module